jgi:hypothetical protein
MKTARAAKAAEETELRQQLEADPLGWLRDTTPAQTDRLPFIKE